MSDSRPGGGDVSDSRRGGGDRGSVLLLVPAAVLVLLGLACIAVDSAVVFMGQRELVSAAAAAANDAAGAAVGDRALYEQGQVEVDPGRAAAVAAASALARAPKGVDVGPPQVTVDGRQVCVTLVGRVRRIVARAVPGVPAEVMVRARAVATIGGDTGPAVPRSALCG